MISKDEPGVAKSEANLVGAERFGRRELRDHEGLFDWGVDV
jgi:hypothetical protein